MGHAQRSVAVGVGLERGHEWHARDGAQPANVVRNRVEVDLQPCRAVGGGGAHGAPGGLLPHQQARCLGWLGQQRGDQALGAGRGVALYQHKVARAKVGRQGRQCRRACVGDCDNGSGVGAAGGLRGDHTPVASEDDVVGGVGGGAANFGVGGCGVGARPCRRGEQGDAAARRQLCQRAQRHWHGRQRRAVAVVEDVRAALAGQGAQPAGRGFGAG